MGKEPSPRTFRDRLVETAQRHGLTGQTAAIDRYARRAKGGDTEVELEVLASFVDYCRTTVEGRK